MWWSIYLKDGGDGGLTLVIWHMFLVLLHYCDVNLEVLLAPCFLQVTDLTLARDNQTEFEEYLRSNQNVTPGIDLTVTVLTTGFWPSYKSFDLNLPAEMVTAVSISIFFK